MQSMKVGVLTSQSENREKVIEWFRKNETNVLVSTDLWSRGLDFQNVALVLHIPSFQRWAEIREKIRKYTKRQKDYDMMFDEEYSIEDYIDPTTQQNVIDKQNQNQYDQISREWKIIAKEEEWQQSYFDENGNVITKQEHDSL